MSILFRVLFQNKKEVWEEIEAINSDNDIPTQKMPNKVCNFLFSISFYNTQMFLFSITLLFVSFILGNRSHSERA